MKPEHNQSEVLQKARAEAFLRGYTELYEWLQYAESTAHGTLQPRCSAWAHSNHIGPALVGPDFRLSQEDFSVVIQQAEAMGMPCPRANKDYLPYLDVRQYSQS